VWQGRGIFLTDSLDRLADMEGVVVQKYIRNPLLVGAPLNHASSHRDLGERNDKRSRKRGGGAYGQSAKNDFCAKS
jgi:hypothetical protein